MSTVKIQADISGYQGPAISLMGAVDTGTGLLIVAKELPHGHRDVDTLVTTNDPRAERRDTLFDEDRFQHAIRLFFRAKSTAMVELLPTLAKHDPELKIENSGVDEHGTKYRLSPDISNGAVAVLALIDAADRAYNVEAASDFSSEIEEMFLSI